MVLSRECGLTHDDLEHMTFGMALDFIDEYLEMKNPDKQKQSNVRKASQADMDAF